MTHGRSLGLALALVLWSSALSTALVADARSTDPAGVFQLVQERAGRQSCWGVVIRLKRLTFKHSILADQLEIRDDKYDHDLRGAMVWAVDREGRQLTIQWQPGKGDFGTGNAVRVCVERSAFREGSQPSNERECWSIGTDLL